MRNATVQASSTRRRVSEGLVVIAIALLLILIADTSTGRGGIGFLGMNQEQSGQMLGTPSIVLFLAAFGVGFRQKSMITTALLIGGGALYIAYLIAGTMTMTLLFYYGNTTMFYVVSALSCVAIGLGLLRLTKKMNQTPYMRASES